MKLTDRVLLRAADTEASLHFYRDILGMEAVREGNRYLLRCGSFAMALEALPSDFKPAAGYTRIGSVNLCFISELPAETLFARYAEAGAEPVSDILSCRDPRNVPIRCFYLSDPDGNLVQVASMPPAEAVPEDPEDVYDE